MSHDYLLSICMMVRDEEKNLKRCLDAVKSLVDRDDVELIIVDTGSKDSTVDIAREYTDKVYFHPWNNNFAAMRNVTVSYARGEYILIMDADEVLTDPASLYKYISDESLKDYNTFTVKIKNFDSSGGYTVITQERVFKNDGSFGYEGSVHNQPKFKKPVLHTDIYMDHYGYLFHDRELREKKFVRTAGILKKELEKNPNSIYYRFQLARSYSAHRDKKEAFEEIRKAYRLLTANKEVQRLYAYVYGTYCIICFENNEFDEVIRACGEGLELRSEYIDLYYLMAAAYARTGRDEEAFAAYEKYIELVKQYDDLAISADSSMEMYFLSEKYQDGAYAFMANYMYQKGKYNECYGYALEINDQRTKSERIVRVLFKLKKYDELKSFYDSIIGNKPLREATELLIEAEASALNNDERKKIYELFSNGDGHYSILNRIRISDGDEKRQLVSDALRNLDFNELPDYYADMFADIDKDPRPVISLFKKLRKVKIKQFVKRLVDRDRKLENFFEQYLLDETVRPDDHSSLKVYIGIAYTLLVIKAVDVRESGTEPLDRYLEIFEKYSKNGFSHIMTLYRPERLRIYYSTMEDREDAFFIALHYAEEACGKGDYKAGVKYFRDAARANAYMACYMKKFKDKLFKDTADEGTDDND